MNIPHQFTYHLPSKIVFGSSFLDVLKSEAGQYGSKTLLATGKNFIFKTGLYDKAVAALKKSNIQVVSFNDIGHDPDFETVNTCLQKAKSEKVNFIIAFGGGSVIDVAKLTAAVYENPEIDLPTHTDKGKIQSCMWKGTKKSLNLIAIPTTAGSGSEVSRAAVITDRKFKIKCSIKSPYFYPSLSIVDSSLTHTLSKELTAYTGIDALTHLTEGYLSRGASIFTDLLALEGIKLIVKNLPKAVKNPEDSSARQNMMLASMYGGIVDSNAGLGVDHVVAHILGAWYGIPHGHACAILLPATVGFNAESQKNKVENILKIFKKTDPEETLWSFIKDHGIVCNLRELNVHKADIPKIADKAYENQAALSFNPRELTVKDIQEILNRSY